MLIPSRLAIAVRDGAIQRAEQLGVAASIVVVDVGGHLKTLHRMDGAWLASVDIAMKKAKTAILFNLETQVLDALMKPDGEAHGASFTNDTLITFAGGIPLQDHSGDCIGAIGVSGGAVEQDYQIASAGAAACKADGAEEKER